MLKRPLLRGFLRDRRGNVAMMFAAFVVPFIGFVGAAVDYSRASRARTSMLAALDATALMVSKEIGGDSITQKDLAEKAERYFRALYLDQETNNIQLTATFESDPISGSRVKLTTTGYLDTTFIKVIGHKRMDIGASTMTSWGATRLRVALALDVTGSMKGDKMKAMIASAIELVKTLRTDAVNVDDVRISVIPFAQQVNVGVANRNATWLTWDEWDKGVSRPLCNYVADFRGAGSWVCKGSSSSKNRDFWSGCVADRDMPFDTTGAPASDKKFPAASSFEIYPPPNSSPDDCPPQLLPLTSIAKDADAKIVTDRISTLVDIGGTNQVIGTAWGWLTLLPNSPFPAPAKDESKRYTDALIILSDGENTYTRFEGNGRLHVAAIDERQKLLCKNIKATSTPRNPVVIYSIQVNTGGDPESAVLKACADPGNFHITKSAAGIPAIFAAIGRSLSKLRIAQ